MAKSERTSTDYSSIDDLSLPRGASAALYRHEHFPILERSSSDSNLNSISPQSWSNLSVDKTSVLLRAGGKNHEAGICVEWDIIEDVGAQDWIGLFYFGEVDTSKFLECKTRGSSGGSRGAIVWDLNAVEHLFSEFKTDVCFKYISGNSGEVLATSPLVTVALLKNETKSPSQASGTKENSLNNALFSITIEDVMASNLKKGMFFNPDPYVKFQILPHNSREHIESHHYQKVRSTVATNTGNPSWRSEKFTLTVHVSDLLEVEVKHKFSKSRPTMCRFLGRATLPIQSIIDQIAEQKPAEFLLELMRKGPSDNVSGAVQFKVHLQLVLQDDGHKMNGCLQRQTSLPATLSKQGENTPRTSHIRHRHTDPGLVVSDPHGRLTPTWDISEETEQCEEAVRAGPSSPDYQLPGETSLMSRQDAESSDSGTSMSAGDKLDVSLSPKTSLNPTDSSSSLQGACARPEGGDGQSFAAAAACCTTADEEGQPELDMTVQSGGPVFPSALKPEAPTLPPRTYKAPPLPPRINKTSAPPLPPRPTNNHETSKPRLEPPPPPLPPRTYSPVECREVVELFPWGPPVIPVSPTSTHQPASPNAGVRGSNHSSDRSAHLALVPSSSDRAAPSPPASRAGIDNVAGSRVSLAMSTTSEPSALGASQSLAAHIKRRSVDGLAQLTNLSSTRQRQLSSEERQQNRQLISQNLELWTRSKTQKPATANGGLEESSPPSFSECEAARSTEHLSPPIIVPRLCTTSGQVDAADGHSHGISSHSGVQVDPTNASSATAALSRDRFKDRGGMAGAEGGEPPRKRAIKYPRHPDIDDVLPSGWEARVDSHGRIFYIDHVNRTTTWQRPQTGFQTVQRRPTLSSEQRQQLDRRYQSIRRTITQNHPVDAEASGDSSQPTGGASNASDNSPSSATPSDSLPDRTADRSERSVYKFPAVKFLTRPDFFPMLQVNENAMVEYNRTSKLKHMITKIRKDPKTFERYQHNRDLVSFVNLFCDKSKELPRRWEMKYDKSGKAFFIDHVLRTTTFMDPRLPTDVPPINPDFLQTPPPRPPPPPKPAVSEAVAPIPTAYNEKVVVFLRQANVDDMLRERCPQYASSSSLREKVNKIAARGVDMLERFSNDIDLTLLLSLFENEIMSYVPIISNRRIDSLEAASQGSPQGSPVQRGPGRVPAPYKRDFQAKLRNFYRKLESKGYGQGPGKLKLTVRRDHVLEDAFNKIMSTPKKELQKNKLYITFAGEEGLDYGGPSREFFFLLSRELFNPYYGLFEYSANDTYTVQVSPLSTFVENAHEWFRFSGRVLGLALVHQYLLDAFFTRPFYKSLLRVPLSLEDVESLDMEFHQSLLWIKDNDISEVDLDLTFSVSEEVFGQVTERELKPNGKNIVVTERNKKEYIEKMVKWRLERGVTEQTDSLIRGFHEVLDGRLVSVFDARELELVIAGTVEIDIGDWRRNTDYRSGYHDQHTVIQWFWEAIEKFDNERQLRLLQFVTGSSSIPYEGFTALRGSNGPRKFCIEKWGKVTSLPRAHTCFNRLDLPPYTSFEMLFEKLVMAVEETSTFGID